ncbi:MAG: S-methyl-5-thioribose-1-phosphate isomerase, partial [Nitrospirota bacterium]
MVPTVEWTNGVVRLLDQSRLPEHVEFLDCRDYRAVADAIRELKVRGAPAIGVTAALGVALGAQSVSATEFPAFTRALLPICDHLAATRPTAVNLFWAIDRMKKTLASLSAQTVPAVKAALLVEAQAILDEDIALCKAMGKHGAELIAHGQTVLTHCNAGALATAGYGTALGVIRAAWEQGKKIQVIADETRPVLQGARLTAWELMQDKIPVTLITDNMAGSLMRQGKIQLCVVGADRIAANGDVANKIGTYSVAVLAKAHGIPFYVAAPYSTIDLK